MLAASLALARDLLRVALEPKEPSTEEPLDLRLMWRSYDHDRDLRVVAVTTCPACTKLADPGACVTTLLPFSPPRIWRISVPASKLQAISRLRLRSVPRMIAVSVDGGKPLSK